MTVLDPNTPPIGRQPELRRITPSQGNPWYGGWEDRHRFSQAQERELMKRGGDVPTAEALLVKRQATPQEYSWPLGTLPPVFAFDCPVIGKTADKVRVIAPDGRVKLVLPDGWAHHPQRRPRDMWGNRL